jgi:branched-chain amino acid transport system permease protein
MALDRVDEVLTRVDEWLAERGVDRIADLDDRVVRSSTNPLHAVMLVSLLVFGLVAPLLVSRSEINLLNAIVVFSVLAIAFNFLFGFMNLPAFGHAAFFGLGAYGVGITLEHFPNAVLLPLLTGVVASLLFALLVATISTRGHGIYFALLTFAFAQFLFIIFQRVSEISGGVDGILIRYPISLGRLEVYYISVAVLLVVLVFGDRLLNSPFGRIMIAIRSNEERAKAVGYPVRRMKVVAFLLSAFWATVSGVLFALAQSFVSPEVLHFTVSVEAVIFSILGGVGALTGPIFGVAFVLILEDAVREFAEIGSVTIGVIFILAVLYVPEGIVGKLKELSR